MANKLCHNLCLNSKNTRIWELTFAVWRSQRCALTDSSILVSPAWADRKHLESPGSYCVAVVHTDLPPCWHFLSMRPLVASSAGHCPTHCSQAAQVAMSLSFHPTLAHSWLQCWAPTVRYSGSRLSTPGDSSPASPE